MGDLTLVENQPDFPQIHPIYLRDYHGATVSNLRDRFRGGALPTRTECFTVSSDSSRKVMRPARIVFRFSSLNRLFNDSIMVNWQSYERLLLLNQLTFAIASW